MQDAIFKVKTDLGPDAIILDTKKFKQGGFLGFFTKTMVEVVAGLETQKKKEEEDTTLKEINDLKNMVHEMHKGWKNDKFFSDLPDNLTNIYKYLINQGVNNQLLKEIIKLLQKKDIANSQKLIESLKTVLKQYIGKCQEITVDNGQKVVALVGSTGVGKTTTIAKLAAHFVLDQGKKVCFITTDTYRIAAVQQLQTYSDIINIPLHVVYNEKELERLITKDLKNSYDLILIDTAGSSWNDGFQLGKLKKIFKNNLIDEVHLLLSLNAKTSIIKEVINKFSAVNPNKLILTKFDEVSVFGDILNIKNICKLPYSYITNGQNVPDDIKAASEDILINYLLGDLIV